MAPKLPKTLFMPKPTKAHKESLAAALLDLADQQAHLVSLSLQQAVVPSWVIITQSGEARIQATPWKDAHEKELARHFITAELRRCNAQAYSFVCEAWMSKAPKDWNPEEDLSEAERPINRPDRIEVIVALANDGTQTLARRWEIKRDSQGLVCALEPMGESTASQGWTAELLPLK